MPRSYGITNAAPWPTAPPVGAAGDIYYNTTNSTLYVCDGTSWLPVAGSSGPGGPLNDGTLLQMTWTDFVGTGRTNIYILPAITIPAWAMQSGASKIDVMLEAFVSTLTANSTFNLDLTTTSLGWSANPASGDSSTAPKQYASISGNASSLLIAATWTVPASGAGVDTTLVARLNAARSAGTGALRAQVGMSELRWRIRQ